MAPLLLLVAVWGCSPGQEDDLEAMLAHRPDTQRLVFDQAGLLTDLEESFTRSLRDFRGRHHIEMLVVVLPSLQGRYTVNEAAATLFSQWGIGRDTAGGGVLLLLVDDAKEVKLEVSFELEGIYTDQFTGSVERRQLRSRFVAEELEIGLIAVMEELEARAQLLQAEIDIDDAIGKRDARYLSQGAGARVALMESTEKPSLPAEEVNPRYPAGATVEEAWQSLLRRWKEKERDPSLQVFLPTGRLAYRDFSTMPVERLAQQYRTYHKRPYQVLKQGDYGVIYFGKKEGWDNAPFLFCRTETGWQFDLVRQKRFIRMGPSPTWGVEFSDHPYMLLLWDAYRFYGQDIPLAAEERYNHADDSVIAASVLALEAKAATDVSEYATLLELGRLYALTSMSRKAIKYLNQAQQLRPEAPEPYRYLAIAHVNGFYQYDSALTALRAARAKGGDDPFLANFTGYLFYLQKRYAEAAVAFEQALALDAANAYSHFYLAFTYAWLVQQSENPSQKQRYEGLYYRHLDWLRSSKTVPPARLRRLNEWLER